MLTILTVNLRFDTESDGEFRWANRRGSIRGLIERMRPDVIATQEGLRPQLEDLASLLPEYELADAHRTWIDRRMYPCIFVRSDRLTVRESGDCWLSPTPKIAESKIIGSNYPRLMSWVRLAVRDDPDTYLVANVHLDNSNRKVRARQMSIAADELGKARGSDALVLCGDFNDMPDGPVRDAVYRKLPDLYDPWKSAAKREQSTVRGFPNQQRGTADEQSAGVVDAPRIDWILLDHSLTFTRVARIEETPEGMPPTDHFPVICEGVRSHAESLEMLRRGEPQVWRNPGRLSISELTEALPFGRDDLRAAAERLRRLTTTIARLFPEDCPSGRITSPLRRLNAGNGTSFFAKCDNELPVAGSIKARGGFYEMLLHAERVASVGGFSGSEALVSDGARELFARRTISVASTGNLGLSIGLVGRALGFRVVVYMSRDARDWKKRLLRQKGAEVVECDDDYSAAVIEAREAADATSSSDDDDAARADTYFVDDEESPHLFMGYACAAEELAMQLQEAGVLESDGSASDPSRSISVYMPCGVGGGPGGVTFGLKTVLSDSVSCWFVEPVAAPCFLLAMLSDSLTGGGQTRPPHIRSVGLDGKTVADGLAVGAASPLVFPIMRELLDGLITTTDDAMIGVAREAGQRYGLKVEPSAAAAICGRNAVSEAGAIDVVWLTGGSLVPEEEFDRIVHSQ